MNRETALRLIPYDRGPDHGPLHPDKTIIEDSISEIIRRQERERERAEMKDVKFFWGKTIQMGGLSRRIHFGMVWLLR